MRNDRKLFILLKFKNAERQYFNFLTNHSILAAKSWFQRS